MQVYTGWNFLCWSQIYPYISKKCQGINAEMSYWLTHVWDGSTCSMYCNFSNINIRACDVTCTVLPNMSISCNCYCIYSCTHFIYSIANAWVAKVRVHFPSRIPDAEWDEQWTWKHNTIPHQHCHQYVMLFISPIWWIVIGLMWNEY